MHQPIKASTAGAPLGDMTVQCNRGRENLHTDIFDGPHPGVACLDSSGVLRSHLSLGRIELP